MYLLDNQSTLVATSPCSNNSSSTLVASSNCDKSHESKNNGSPKTSPQERKVQSPSKLHGFPLHHGPLKFGSILSDAAKELVEKYDYFIKKKKLKTNNLQILATNVNFIDFIRKNIFQLHLHVEKVGLLTIILQT